MYIYIVQVYLLAAIGVDSADSGCILLSPAMLSCRAAMFCRQEDKVL